MKIDTKLFYDSSQISIACSKAEMIVAIQILKDTRPYVPALTMSFNQRSHTIGRNIIYPGPYAHYLWFGKRMVDSATGRGPFYIKGVGWRYRKGAKLMPTSTDLNFSHDKHPMAQSHWMDASFAANKEKWAGVAKKAVAQYGK